MAKDTPYFKFYVSEWKDGDITLEDFETQGLFINICAIYWSKEGNVFLSKLQKRFKNAKPTAFNSLIEEGIIKVNDDDVVSVTFLDEQLEQRKNLSKRNSENGKRGGRPKKPTALVSVSEKKANESNIEEKRREEKKEEEINIHPLRS